MVTARLLTFALAVTSAVVILSAAQEIPGCYEAVAEIRMSEPGEWADARALFGGAAAKDGFVYVVSRADLLLVFDMPELEDASGSTRIASPLREIPLLYGNCNGVLRDGDRLYVYGWSGGQIFDVRDAANPVEVGSFRDTDEHIIHLIKHGDLLIAACLERIVAYSVGLMPNHPMIAFRLPMEPQVQVNAVAIVGDRLCASGIRLRSSGAADPWLGIWDVSIPSRPSLACTAKMDACGSQLLAQDVNLLRVAGGGAEFWDVGGSEPVLKDAASACGRAVALDGDVLVFDGVALVVEDGQFVSLCTFEACADTCYDGFPQLGASVDGLVLLPRPRSILVLRQVERS